MIQDEEKKKELERQLFLSNVRTLLLLDQAGLLKSPLPSGLRSQLCWEYRQAEGEKNPHEDGPGSPESFRCKID